MLRLRLLPLIAGMTCLWVLSCEPSPPTSSKKLSKYDRIAEAMRMEFEATKDPALGYIPRERLKLAREITARKQQILEDKVSRGEISTLYWEERGPNNVAGRTRAVLVDANDATGNTIFAGSVSGGLWKATNFTTGTPSWTHVDAFWDNLAITSIAQDPTDSDTIYVGTGEGFFNYDFVRGEGIWRSTDGGTTFTQLSSTDNSNFHYVLDLAIASNGDLYAATLSGVRKSTDAGQTWTVVLGTSASQGSSNSAYDVEFSANGTIYAALSGAIWKSSTGDNGGWTDITPPASTYARIKLATAPSDANRLYALCQGSASNDVTHIFRSDDGGAAGTWTSLTVPTIIDQGSNSVFTRSQAWYNLSAAVDPNDEDILLIAGIDLLRTTNAGSSWQQITSWSLFPSATTSAAGLGTNQNIHADHHNIVYYPGSSTQAIVATDGGLYYSSDINNTGSTPSFTDKNEGFNVTQFYAAAVHPTAGTDYFLAGSQDNGTQQFNSSGINTTNEVVGGDGGFCHIDEDNPSIQIAAYVYSYFRISTNSFSSYSNVTIGSGLDGQFINPSDYDSDNNILYAGGAAGNYGYISSVGTSNTTGTRTVAAFSGGSITSVTLSPNTANRVFFGLNNGDVVRVDDAHSGSFSGSVIYAGIGTVSSIAVEEGDDDHIVITFSNYGVSQVLETTDGGSSWSVCDGNLPDMPVRFALFAPGQSDSILLATETGVWSTGNLDAGSTTWSPSNTGLANCRVDMLQWRAADNVIVAATHGRGLFTSTYFSTVTANLDATTLKVQEGNQSGSNTNFSYRDYTLGVTLDGRPNDTTRLDISINGSSTAGEGVDFDLVGDSLVFLPGESLTQNITLRIYNDDYTESSETIVLDLSVNSPSQTNVVMGTSQQATVTVLQSDLAPTTSTSYQQIGSATITHTSQPFAGGNHDSRTQILWTASELSSAGLSAGTIKAWAFRVLTKGSSAPYTDFTVKLGHTTLTEAPSSGLFVTDAETVYSGDLNTASGWNVITFTEEFVWDGASNLVMDICFNNAASTGNDLVYGTDNGNQVVWYQNADNSDGCTILSYSSTDNTRPDARFYQSLASAPSTQIGTSTAYLGPNETVYFYDDAGDVVCRIDNGSHDFGMTTIQIDRSATSAGAAATEFWDSDELDNRHDLISKTLLINPTDNSGSASYTLTYYLSQTEVNNWITATGNNHTVNDLQFVKSPGSITNVSASLPYPDGSINVDSFPTVGTYGTDYIISTSFSNGFSGFGAGVPGEAPPESLPVTWGDFQGEFLEGQVKLIWTAILLGNHQSFDIQRSLDGEEFVSVGEMDIKAYRVGQHTFEFQDLQIQGNAEKYIYRIKELDIDGKQDYSPKIEVNIPRDLSYITVGPNPFENLLQVQVFPSIEGNGRLTLYSLDGRQKRLLYWGVIQSGMLKIPVEDVTPGIYFLQFEFEGQIEWIRKILKQ